MISVGSMCNPSEVFMFAVSMIAMLVMIISMDAIMGMVSNSYGIGVLHVRALRYQNLVTPRDARRTMLEYYLRAIIPLLFFIGSIIYGPKADQQWITFFANAFSLPRALPAELANTFLTLIELSSLLFGAYLFRKFPAWCARFNSLALPVHQLNVSAN